MKLLYADGYKCSKATLKRLVLLGTEVGFMDSPSVVFNFKNDEGKLVGACGTIGASTPLREVPLIEAEVRLSYHKPPSGPDLELYRAYIEKDLTSPEFRSTVMSGLRNDITFARQQIGFESNYSGRTGAEIINALNADTSLASISLDGKMRPEIAFKIDTLEERVETLKAILQRASIDLTSAMVVSIESGLVPVSESATGCRLFAIRMSRSEYVDRTNVVAPQLGIEIMKTVLPDALLAEIEINDIVEYRKKTNDTYGAWSVELNRLAAKVEGLSPDQLQAAVPRLVASEVMPKYQEYKNELVACRDQMFGDIVKRLTQLEFPTLCLSHVFGVSTVDAMKYFAAAAIPTIPILVDYFKNRRAADRKYGLTYLLGVSK